jgi:hypothetical protein
MKSFKEQLRERFINLIQPNSDEDRLKYRDQVWDLLQKSYADIGGIKGTGFSSPDELVQKIPFWKLVVDKGTVRAVVMYKDSNGRKSVAMGSDGSDYANKHIASIVREDIKRSFGEKSKKALGLIMREVPWVILEQYIFTPDEAAKALGKETTAVTNLNLKDLPADAIFTLKKYPKLMAFGYLRNLKGSPAFKVMFGTSGKTIR